jgi:hypothetical protein
MVTDDGLPRPRVPVARPAPSTGLLDGARGGQVNFGAQVDRATVQRPRGLTVSWLQLRGPAKIAFEPGGATPVTNGAASTTARFTEPGTYQVRATASDGSLSTRRDVTITVIDAR